MAAFERLIRFETGEGKTMYGNLKTEMPTRDIEGSEVEVLEGDIQSGFKKSGGSAKVGKVRSNGLLMEEAEERERERER
jgi:transcription initiation factor TFIIH subunit 2